MPCAARGMGHWAPRSLSFSLASPPRGAALLFPKFSRAREGDDSPPSSSLCAPPGGEGDPGPSGVTQRPSAQGPHPSLRSSGTLYEIQILGPPPPGLQGRALTPAPRGVWGEPWSSRQAQSGRVHLQLPQAGGSSGENVSPSPLRLQAWPCDAKGSETCPKPKPSAGEGAGSAGAVGGLHPLPSWRQGCSAQWTRL